VYAIEAFPCVVREPAFTADRQAMRGAATSNDDVAASDEGPLPAVLTSTAVGFPFPTRQTDAVAHNACRDAMVLRRWRQVASKFDKRAFRRRCP